MATVPAAAAATPVDRASLYAMKPSTRRFVNRRDQPRLTPQQAVRQGRAVTVALRSFSSLAAAMTFLNTDQPDLGRPLDLALESAAGLAAVERVLELRSVTSG